MKKKRMFMNINLEITHKGRGMTQLVEGLPNWVWFLAPHKPSLSVHTCNLSTWEMETEGSGSARLSSDTMLRANLHKTPY